MAEAAIRAALGARGPFGVSESQISEIVGDYGLGPKEVRAVVQKVWAHALESVLADGRLTDEELQYLERLCRILDIGFDDIEQIKARVIHPKYRTAVAEAAKDGTITGDERRFLNNLYRDLRLPEELAREISAAPIEEVVQARVQELIADGRFSPSDFDDLDRLGQSLGIKINLSPETHAFLARLASLWRAESGDLEAIPVPITLQKSEQCYFASPARWYEHRSRTVRVDYAGPVASIRVARGLRFRMGSVTPRRVTTEELTLIDEGTIYITSKRVLLDGTRRNTNLRLSSLIGFEAFSDGFVLEKSSGRSPHVVLEGDAELAGIILARVLAHG